MHIWDTLRLNQNRTHGRIYRYPDSQTGISDISLVNLSVYLLLIVEIEKLALSFFVSAFRGDRYTI